MKSQTDKRIDGIPLGDTGLTIFFGNTTPTPLSDGVKEGDVWFVTLPSASSGNTEFECAYQYRNGDWVNVGYFPEGGGGGSYTAGRGIDLTNDVISIKLGEGLKFDAQGRICLDVEPVVNIEYAIIAQNEQGGGSGE